ncbi:hypothetical protein [Neobacillus jeddahensis]|nr:hypothetical protein [Neobacillus jeddahensis]
MKIPKYTENKEFYGALVILVFSFAPLYALPLILVFIIIQKLRLRQGESR